VAALISSGCDLCTSDLDRTLGANLFHARGGGGLWRVCQILHICCSSLLFVLVIACVATMADASAFQSELYKAAVKRSSADLISELAVAFPHNSSLERIHALTRTELLDAVIQTRTRLNSLSAIRQVVNGGEKPPELFARVGNVPTGGSKIAEQGGAVHVTTVTTSTPTTAVVVTTAAMIGTQTVTSPQQVQPSLPGVHVSRPAVSGVITTPAIQQSAGHVQPSGGAPDMSGFGGIAQILAMMNAQNAQLATQSAERDASLKLQLAKLAQASEEKERMAKERK